MKETDGTPGRGSDDVTTPAEEDSHPSRTNDTTEPYGAGNANGGGPRSVMPPFLRADS